MDISTTYMGLSLRSPLVVSSSGLTSTAESIKKLADAGAGAVVLKSLFQEQLVSDASALTSNIFLGSHADTGSFVSAHSVDYYLDQYLALIEKSRALTDIPIIASLNCHAPGDWIDYLPQIERYGASAIELNMYNIAMDVQKRGVAIEKEYAQLIKKVRQAISIPVSIKIGPYFTNLPSLIERIEQAGAQGLVLFNRFFSSDIDIEKETIVGASSLSEENEYLLSLRWIALLSHNVDLDLAANTGVHTGETLIKQLLAGAQVVELCSTIIRNGIEQIDTINKELSSWMSRKGYNSLAEFRGKLSQGSLEEKELWKRSQYIRALTGMA